MKNRKTERKPLSFIKKLFLQITVSSLLLFIIYLSQSYAPAVFGKIKSNLTYAPDLSFVGENVREFILKYTPR